MASFSADQPALTYGSAISFRGTADEEKDILDQVSHYYGRVLNNSADLKTNSCCTFQRPTQRVADALNNIHTDVKEKYYGCGFVAPERLEGLKVLDLGCGAGRDCYILSQLVGESGEVVGVDMTDEQLNVAQTYQEWHRVKFGYAKSNIKFVKGHIEQLDEILVDDQYFDLIVSNCVINLSPNKAAVFKQAYRLLKEGNVYEYAYSYTFS